VAKDEEENIQPNVGHVDVGPAENRADPQKWKKKSRKRSHNSAWNSLPPHLRTITDTNTFKRHLKSFVYTKTFSVLLALLDKLYSSAIQITDCIVLYSRLPGVHLGKNTIGLASRTKYITLSASSKWKGENDSISANHIHHV